MDLSFPLCIIISHTIGRPDKNARVHTQWLLSIKILTEKRPKFFNTQVISTLPLSHHHCYHCMFNFFFFLQRRQILLRWGMKNVSSFFFHDTLYISSCNCSNVIWPIQDNICMDICLYSSNICYPHSNLSPKLVVYTVVTHQIPWINRFIFSTIFLSLQNFLTL